MKANVPAPSLLTVRAAVVELPSTTPPKSICTALRSIYPPAAVWVPVKDILVSAMPVVGKILRDPAMAPGLTSTPLAIRVCSIAADVKFSTTGIVKDAPAARVAGTPEHWKMLRLVLQPFSLRAKLPAVHLTLIDFVRPATTEPKPVGLGVQVIRGVVDAPIP